MLPIVSLFKGLRSLGERDTGPDQMCVFNDLGLLAFRGGSNKFDDVWAVDCFSLSCAFKGAAASGRDFFAFALTGAFKGV